MILPYSVSGKVSQTATTLAGDFMNYRKLMFVVWTLIVIASVCMTLISWRTTGSFDVVAFLIGFIAVPEFSRAKKLDGVLAAASASILAINGWDLMHPNAHPMSPLQRGFFLSLAFLLSIVAGGIFCWAMLLWREKWIQERRDKQSPQLGG